MAKNIKHQYINYFLGNGQIPNKQFDLDLSLWNLK